ncbi:beta-ketoacyl-ACP synthase [Candidatus Scalindua japonica]|uniref:Beta-ketoacyl-ACP synthase n=1 Tax=Candidatus Scalindua japonica TaxID=1284222 RepID=A0A286TTF6_9BACT|nr:beta-ketoacyl synthase N-terminal-like domain-containing protein [Candidatus Scalindua japonica]GAX59170.1 beta-ketoacyl-ACP synthase [Candidatus Scalindua japonica]
MGRVVITGYGVINSVGHNVEDFTESLRSGKSGISTLLTIPTDTCPVKIGAEIKDFSYIDYLNSLEEISQSIYTISRKVCNNSNLSTQISSCAAIQAYLDAELIHSLLDSSSIGIIVSGNNISQKYIIDNYDKFLKEPEYINPKYAISFLDTNIIGAISEILNIKGIGYSVGGASASGNLGLYNAYQLIQAGTVKACLCVGALADFSELELKAFSILGAMTGQTFNDQPEKASRPFDKKHDGFVFGQGSGCVVLESMESALSRDVQIRGEIVSAASGLDGNHLTNPSIEGEIKVMQSVLQETGITTKEIDYINTHGTSSPLGDITELDAIKHVFKECVKSIHINSTKSLIGHCIYSAGVVELIATLIQMKEGFYHPDINLDDPIDRQVNFVGKKVLTDVKINYALSNSFGFGGINSSILVKNQKCLNR